MGSLEKKEIEKLRQAFVSHQPFHSSISGLVKNENEAPSNFRMPGTVPRKVKKMFRELLAEFTDTEFEAFPEYAKRPWSPYWDDVFRELVRVNFLNPGGIHLDTLYNDEPKLVMVRSYSPSPEDTDGHILNKVVCTSTSPDLDTALSKVVGELLERIPLLCYRTKNLIKASVIDLRKTKRNFLDPSITPGFLEWQKKRFPQREYTENSQFYWVKARDVISNATVLVPSQFIFWNYHPAKAEGEPHLREANTNGAAGHFSVEKAILGGLYELIQRDAFMIYWLYNQPPPRIKREGIKNVQLLDVLEKCDRYQLAVHFLYTTLDINVPSCVAVLIDERGGPAVAMGGGCDQSLEEAMLSSLTEALGVRHWIRERESVTYEPVEKPFTQSDIGQRERLAIWAGKEMPAHIEHFLSGKEISLSEVGGREEFASPNEELKWALDLFRKKGSGYEVYVYEAKHPALTSLSYHSVRVVVPKLIPLYLNETQVHLTAYRYKEVADTFNWNPAGFPNPIPHPFP